MNEVFSAQEQSRHHSPEDIIRDNKGTRAICAYFYDLFERNHSGYRWMKANPQIPLYPRVLQSGVELCYSEQVKNSSLWSHRQVRNIAIASYSFEEIYQWYPLAKGEGFTELTNRDDRVILADLISQEILRHDHIKNSNGLVLADPC